jgi:hypothetical protein
MQLYYLGHRKITIKKFFTFLMAEQKKQKLEQQLWNIANTSKMDADEEITY